MNISCTQENLNKGLNLVSHIAGKDANLPVLNNVLLKAENKILKIFTTNLEMGITTIVRGKVDEDGEFITPAKQFADYINLLPKNNVEIKNNGDILKITCGNYNTEIKGSVENDFPVIPTIKKENGFNLNLLEFKKALQDTVFSANLSNLRPEIGGIYINFDSEKAVFVATDSYRLAEKSIKYTKVKKTDELQHVSIIIPLKTAQEILRILNSDNDVLVEDKDKAVSLYIEENQVLIDYNNTELISKIIEGQYPDYKQLIPQDFKTNIILDKDELQKAIKTTSLFTKSGVYDIVLKADIAKDSLELFAENSQLGKNLVKINAKISGENNEVVLNSKYLLEGLQHISTSDVVIDIIDHSTPCIIRPYADEKIDYDYFYLIMPIRQ
jgi:DNA polymerase-3 subunit beta